MFDRSALTFHWSIAPELWVRGFPSVAYHYTRSLWRFALRSIVLCDRHLCIMIIYVLFQPDSMRDREWINIQARQFLSLLNSFPFTDCHALTRNFSDVTPRPGLYAFRHPPSGILYIGKSQNARKRLRGGHKALGWAFIDRLDPNDVRIAVVTLDWEIAQHTLDIEARMIQTLRPRYNVQIRQGD